jgi:hypothetical protein
LARHSRLRGKRQEKGSDDIGNAPQVRRGVPLSAARPHFHVVGLMSAFVKMSDLLVGVQLEEWLCSLPILVNPLGCGNNFPSLGDPFQLKTFGRDPESIHNL